MKFDDEPPMPFSIAGNNKAKVEDSQSSSRSPLLFQDSSGENSKAKVEDSWNDQSTLLF